MTVANAENWLDGTAPVGEAHLEAGASAVGSSGVNTLLMPQLGETMEEGVVVRWLVPAGEAYARGDAILEIETDKTVAEVPALSDGRLVRILAPEGARLTVYQPIAVGEGEVDGAAPPRARHRGGGRRRACSRTFRAGRAAGRRGAAARLVGLTLAHEPHHVFRAMIEGIGFGTRAILDAFRTGGYASGEITVGGGATSSPLWMQIHADTAGLPVRIPASPDAPSTGSAILAAHGAGRFASIDDGFRAMVRPGGRGEPARLQPHHRHGADCRWRLHRYLNQETTLSGANGRVALVHRRKPSHRTRDRPWPRRTRLRSRAE